MGSSNYRNFWKGNNPGKKSSWIYCERLEPLNLALFEALACGTPVIAYRYGAAAEAIIHGKTGFLVADQDEAVSAVDKVMALDRVQCRADAEQRFTHIRMADEYLSIYQRVLNARENHHPWGWGGIT